MREKIQEETGGQRNMVPHPGDEEEARTQEEETMNTQKPPKIFNLFSFPRHFGGAAKVQIKNAPCTVQRRRSLICKATRQSNALPSSLKFTHPKVFKTSIQKNLIQEVPDD